MSVLRLRRWPDGLVGDATVRGLNAARGVGVEGSASTSSPVADAARPSRSSLKCPLIDLPLVEVVRDLISTARLKEARVTDFHGSS